jgi:glycosyltransferase involved in cell wall biosynthesis
MRHKTKYINKKLLLLKKEENIQKKKKNNFIIILIITLIFLIIFTLIKIFVIKKNTNLDLANEQIINSKVKEILKNYTYNDTIKEEIKPYLKYIEYSKNGKLFRKINLTNINNPRISIVISLYNREQYIKSAIRSVQNQNFSDIEIIVVDDFSTDNSIKYVKEYQKHDPRIVLLQNKENMGTLYSKSIGVLYAKGQYVHSLDSDDMFCNPFYLSLSYNKAIEGNYDFVASNGLYINQMKKTIKFRKPFWVVIWIKLIKREVYQNSIFKLGIDILKMKVVTLDDDIIASYLFLGKRAINLQNVGVAHFTHESQHVYFNAFQNREKAKIFCRHMLKTVKSFYMFKTSGGLKYGQFLFNYLFNNRSRCFSFCKPEEINELIKMRNSTQNFNPNK